jgi:hypothetical protein
VVVLGAGVLAAGVSTGWLLRDHVVATAAVERATPVSTPNPGTSVSVTTGSGTVGELVAMDSRAGSTAAPGCFEAENLPRTWQMDRSRVQWIQSEGRFADGRLVDGAREGCWSFWYPDELFDSGLSGTYEKDKKVAPAPTPLGDFGYTEP